MSTNTETVQYNFVGDDALSPLALNLTDTLVKLNLTLDPAVSGSTAASAECKVDVGCSERRLDLHRR